jgi:LAGLIDADG endonuclease
VGIKASLNRGLSEELKRAFPQIILVSRPLIENIEIPDPLWIAGFTSGDGCFLISITSSVNSKLKVRVQVVFSVIQHIRDEQLIRKFIKYFDCGNIHIKKAGQAVEFVVFKFSDIENKILPFFTKYPVIGEKSKDFYD